MSILDEAKRPEDLDPSKHRIRALLSGNSGSGKTTSALSVPGKKLLIDLDQRGTSAIGNPDTEIVEIIEKDARSPQAWSKCEQLYKELWQQVQKKSLEYDAIIWDGITSMSRMAMNMALLLDGKRGLGGTPAQQHYLPQMKYLTDLIKGSLGLPCHVIFTCHLELIEDREDQSYKLLPKITGKLRTEIGSWFDETYLCQRTSGKGGRAQYSWITMGTGKFDFLKSALNQLGRYWTDPVELEVPKDFSELWGFGKLLDLRFNKKGGDKKESTKAEPSNKR